MLDSRRGGGRFVIRECRLFRLPILLSILTELNLSMPGTVLFANAMFPGLHTDAAATEPMRIGPGCREPYDAPSFFNISGMSFGAVSRPAVKALSRGAALAGVWLNTGEGGLTDWHLEGGCDVVFQIGTAKYGVRDSEGGLADAKLRELAAPPQVRLFERTPRHGAQPGKAGTLAAA